MKPVYLHYSGGEAPKWAAFARKKLKQLTQRLEYSGVSTGRQELKFGNVDIGLLVTPAFNRIRITTAGAVSFGFYSNYNPSLSAPTIVYDSIAGYSADVVRQWQYNFTGYESSGGLKQRRIIGCSSTGDRLLVMEVDSIAGTISVLTLASGALSSTHTYNFTAAGLSFDADDSNVAYIVSSDGNRALIGGLRRMSGSTTLAHGMLYFCRGAEDALQVVEDDNFTTFATPFAMGSLDLRTAYLFLTRAADDGVGETSVAYKKIISTPPSGEEVYDSVVASDEVLSIGSSAGEQLMVIDVAVESGGSFAVAYAGRGAPDGFGVRDVARRVRTSTGSDVFLQTEATVGSLNDFFASVRLLSLRSGAAGFVYAYKDINSLDWLYGVATASSASDYAAGDLAVAVSDNGEYVVVRQTSQYIVRTATADIYLPGLGDFHGGVPYTPEERYYGVTDGGVVLLPARYRFTPSSSATFVVTPRSTGISVTPVFSDAGVLTAYGDQVQVGGTLASVSRTDIDGASITISRMSHGLSACIYSSVFSARA